MPMSSNRAFIQSLYDAFERGDAATVLGGLHPNVTWNEAESHPYAAGNPFVGPDRVGAGVFGSLHRDFSTFSANPERLIQEDDVVVVLGRYTGTHTSGRSLDAQFVHAWTVKDGQVTAFQQYTDTEQWTRVLASV